MDKQDRWLSVLTKILSYILVATVASSVTFFLCLGQKTRGQSKLEQLEELILTCFIGEKDRTAMEDAAAGAMVDSLGDRWSYYIPASEYAAHMEQMNNAYVGIGVTIAVRQDGKGFDVRQVEAGGSAKEAGILPGDIITEVEGQSAAELGIAGAKALIRGQEGTQVSIGVLRGEEKLTFSVARKTVQVTVAEGTMLEGNVGYVQIANFDQRCAQETIAAIESLVEQGTQALIFDVRNNPGGYKRELVEVLDYLLPKGPLFRSLSYTGAETVDSSDKDCLELPMAVLVNGESYSAAEFFAAALDEYDWAVVVGEPTSGKGYFQNTIRLNDGSAVGLSVGKYFTPNGVSLAEVGGLTPELIEEVDEETAALIYAGLLEPEEDPQIRAALDALK